MKRAGTRSAQPTADFCNDAQITLFAFRTSERRSVPNMYAIPWREADRLSRTLPGGGTDIMRYLYGAETYPLPGRIPGWLAV